jgi:hypothetical protein
MLENLVLASVTDLGGCPDAGEHWKIGENYSRGGGMLSGKSCDKSRV